MSVDVEEWFQVGAFERTIDKADWDRLDSRVEANTDAVSSLFAETGTRATFFTLGWVAHRHPGLIRRIVAAGHEMASHGWDHQRVFTMTADQFRADLLRARTAIEDAGGQAVTGYRAPSFSIDTRTPGRIPCWPRRAIVIPPARRAAAARPLWLGGLAALCLAAASRCRSDRAAGDGGAVRPAAAGDRRRLLPDAARQLTDIAIGQVERDRHGAMFYFHPWEIDPGQPRVTAAPLARASAIIRGWRDGGKLRALLGRHDWGRVDQVAAREAAQLA
jgi:peptidoglycan/xylan/chitin deacetylase (PgdA/CDA1 family)